MTEDKIKQHILEIRKLKQQWQDIKSDLRKEEKIDSEEYTDLDKALKDLKQQVKDFKEQWENELLQDKSYVELREMKMKKEEEIAIAQEALWKEIQTLPPRAVDMNMETDEGGLRIQIQPMMKLYLNGKEEKSKA